MSKQKLELTWIGKEKRARLEPRILLEDPSKSYHAKVRHGNSDIFNNILIKGDNLLALKALEQDYTGKVKCIYIDPPYNTGNAFEHYDDGIEHSIWLSLIRDRIEILKNLLAEDGSLWVSLDDTEQPYFRVMCDEIFGRNNFVSNVIWEKKYSPQNNAVWLSDSHDHILLYAKNKAIWRPNPLPRTEEMDARYRNLDNDPRGPWKSVDFTTSLTGGQRGAQYARTGVSANIYEIITPSGRKVLPTDGRCWVSSEKRFKELVEDNRIWFGPKGDNVPSQKRFLSEMDGGTVSKTIWYRSEVGDNQEAKKETKDHNSKELFATPKPERLLERILTLGSNPGDLVLDSFLGSGTTAAVAHKMGRRWIGIELGEHADTHCLPRLKKVIDGEDEGGITKAVNWKGGGGFRYYTLAPSLIKLDEWGNPVINKEFNNEMLVRAVSKIEGFTYAPDEDIFWKQGYSTETDFIYVTTQHLTHQMLEKLSLEVGDNQSLLICCGSFEGKESAWPNLTIKKIPRAILKKCEWNKDDYSLQIQNLPMAAPTPDEPKSSVRKHKSQNKNQLNLFGE